MTVLLTVYRGVFRAGPNRPLPLNSGNIRHESLKFGQLTLGKIIKMVATAHQMSVFKAKMYQIQFRLGLCSRPRWGSLQRSP